MLYAMAADVVLILHAAFILFAVAGGLLLLRWRWLVWLHLPAAGWAALVVTAGWICPLTPIEQMLRGLAGQDGYDGSFIEHYLVMLIYPPGLTRPVQILLGVLVVVVNIAIYVGVWRQHRHASGTANHDH
ncbi:MAG: DUF2784 domain-containing protein [Gammaproteobacteria bacterium]|nr:DUF2784 domain-containing protein [Gammaproteobacteria bacterium]